MILVAPYSISPNHFTSPLHSAPSLELESFHLRIKKLKPKNKGVNKKNKGVKHYKTGHFLIFPLMVVV